MLKMACDARTAFDRISWRDPVSGAKMEPMITAMTPAGVPICGALRVAGTQTGYPIVDCIARLTPALARRHTAWLAQMGLAPPPSEKTDTDFQGEDTVESFGWQWTWNSEMRSESDLRMRVAEKFGVQPEHFRGKLVADMGAGAGDQSRYLLRQGATVISIDLSPAIEVVAKKLRMHGNWFGVQGDITCLPFEDNLFDVVYCEGVIQHTRDSKLAVHELVRVARPGGDVLAAHYTRTQAVTPWSRMKRKIYMSINDSMRQRLSRMERFRLLLITGNLAALSYVPLLGYLIRRTGLAHYYDLMPSFKSTWTNTFDYYGNHSYQRFMSSEQFETLFSSLADVDITYSKAGDVRACKQASRNASSPLLKELQA